jgi:hypothetical protein
MKASRTSCRSKKAVIRERDFSPWRVLITASVPISPALAVMAVKSNNRKEKIKKRLSGLAIQRIMFPSLFVLD